MGNILLILLVILIFKLLFKNFGFLSEEEYKKKKEAVERFIGEENNCSSGDCTNNLTNNSSVFKRTLKIVPVNEVNKKNKEEFDDNIFLKSAEKAIIMITEAFSNKNLELLEKFSTKEMFLKFKTSVDQAIVDKISFKTAIIFFKEKSILKKFFPLNMKKIFVKINTDQINYIENENNIVTEGSKNKIQNVSEIWEFIQNDKNINFWFLNSIEEVN